MGVDLFGKHGGEMFNWHGWRACLERAIEFGWTPEGTLAPTDFSSEWQGGYYSNDYQVVTDSDARALGEAVLRAVAALSARAPDKVQVRKDWPEEEFGADLRALLANYALKGAFLTEEEELADELRCLRKFATYALKGGFTIG